MARGAIGANISRVGPGERHALGLAVDPHRDPADGERPSRGDDGPEPAVEVGCGGEARDPDPGAGGVSAVSL